MDSSAGLAPRPLKTQNHTTAGKISFTEGDIFYTLGQQLQVKTHLIALTMYKCLQL